MLRQDAVAAVIAEAERAGALSVATEQAIGAWRQAVNYPLNGIPDHLEVVGAMGSASSIGLGLALAQPTRTVIVIDGDGSLLMQLGSLVTIAGAAPPNFVHMVFENGVYETSGSQPLPGEGRFDLAAMAQAAGYAHTASFSRASRFAEALPGLLRRQGPVFISVRTEPQDGYLVRSSAGTRMDLQLEALRERLAAQARKSAAGSA
jgi:phosphonopyruvate decarboxylase